ncbi:MutS-related protein [Flavobacterium sp.]|uniref:MutS-related protein n=1 Tax=Flavobacterium sp. TaxID=239 RepID=UPI004033C3BE
MENLSFYKEREAAFTTELAALTRRYNAISIARFAVAIIFIALAYCCFRTDEITNLMVGMAACSIIFFILMHYHGKVVQAKKRAGTILDINTDEIRFLTVRYLPFNDGSQFCDTSHPYTHDLDIFGQRSLFHNLNRTASFKGEGKLAGFLAKTAAPNEILLRQEAVWELGTMPGLRQELMAIGKMNKDSEAAYDRLINWSERQGVKFTIAERMIATALPVLLTLSLIARLVTGNGIYTDIAGYIFGANLVFLLSFLKPIKSETAETSEIHTITKGYGQSIKELENAIFTSAKLKALQEVLMGNQYKASTAFTKLAVLFARLDSIYNGFGAIVFNGLFLFHFHVLYALMEWKKRNAQDIVQWLDAVAEFEALSSLANFSYNNPGYFFPELNEERSVKFTGLAHPLIKEEGRVSNDVDLTQSFMILTGSNMSGKSTFLRSLGINMVLAGAGAPVCAAAASVHPMQVLVSMRLSDSLSDSESYFFAEVKRLRFIMDKLEAGPGFVLLDEILRGTNSEDKRTGSIKVIEKMVALNAVGAIATHDIEVCNIVDLYPGKLSNHCFESQIVDNELFFDYRLREGICRNKSATFLMEKMGVITP